MTRYVTTGRSSPPIVPTGYINRSRYSARWERPSGEPPPWAGAMLLAAVFAIIAIIVAAMPDGPRWSVFDPSRTSRLGHSATITIAKENAR